VTDLSHLPDDVAAVLRNDAELLSRAKRNARRPGEVIARVVIMANGEIRLTVEGL
jgi:hypothetical protein